MSGALRASPVVAGASSSTSWAARWVRWSASASCAASSTPSSTARRSCAFPRAAARACRKALLSLMQMAKTTAALARLARGAAAVHLGADRPDDGRRVGELRVPRRRRHRRAEGADRLRRPARHRADRAREAARRLPARRVPAREGRDRHDRRPPRAARTHRRAARGSCCAEPTRLPADARSACASATRRGLAGLAAGLRIPATIELGLDRVGAVLRRGSGCHCTRTVITVAGTNGKGSTCAMLEAILRAAGYRVGCFTSPHLRALQRAHPRARRARSADAELLAGVRRGRSRARRHHAHLLRVDTLAASCVCSRARLDVAVLEVGLGGRLDAVNSLDADCAAVVTHRPRPPRMPGRHARGDRPREGRHLPRRPAGDLSATRRCRSSVVARTRRDRRAPAAYRPRLRLRRARGRLGLRGLRLAPARTAAARRCAAPPSSATPRARWPRSRRCEPRLPVPDAGRARGPRDGRAAGPLPGACRASRNGSWTWRTTRTPAQSLAASLDARPFARTHYSGLRDARRQGHRRRSSPRSKCGSAAGSRSGSTGRAALPPRRSPIASLAPVPSRAGDRRCGRGTCSSARRDGCAGTASSSSVRS